MIFILNKYGSCDKIKKNEMGGKCSTYEEDERRIQWFGVEIWGKEFTWEYKG